MFNFALFLLDFFMPRIEEPKKLSEACMSRPGANLSLRYGNGEVFNSAAINKVVSYPGDKDRFSALISIGHDPRNKFTVIGYESIDAARADVIKILTSSSFEGIDEHHLIKGMCYVPRPQSNHRMSPRRERRLNRSLS